MLSTLTAAMFWLFQNFDLVAIAREFGFPIVVCSVMFVYFNFQIRRGGTEVNRYRHETLEQQKSQTDFLKELLSEAKQANYCHVKDADICKFKND